jgi:RHS repeat-associated protein
VGNRLAQDKDGQVTNYVYNDRDQLISETGSSGSTSYAYDQAGRQISKTDANGTTTYTWIDNDRMAAVSGPNGTVSYTYDAEGSRIKTDDTQGAKWYLIDKQLPYGQVIAEYADGGSLTCDYVYGLERISQSRGASKHFYGADGQGSVRQLTDNSGEVTDTWTYTAFGEELARTGNTLNEFRYVGEQWDANVGLYYNRARWMDPSTGRFTSVDPYGGDPQSPVSLHRYLYANGNPSNVTDPTGEFSIVEVITSAYVRASTTVVTFTTYAAIVAKTKANMIFFHLTNAIRMGHARLMTAFNGSVELSRSQAARIQTIKEIAHSWKVRNNLSGDMLDAGHIEKLKNGITGLERSIASLQKSLNNPNLNRATKTAINQAIEEAETLINVAKGLVGG